MVGGVAGGEGDAEDVCGAEGFGGEGGDDGGVDAAGEAEDDALEAALADVIAEAEEEGGVDGGDAGAGRDFRFLSFEFRVGFECGEVDDEEVFLEVFGLGDDVAVGVEDDGVAVEDEFVVAADLVDVDDGHVPAFGLEGEEFVAVFVFAQDEGGGGDVEEEFGAGLGEGADGVELKS